MFIFTRKILYHQELREILAEEEKLLAEWKETHLNATKKFIEVPGGPFVFSGVEHREVKDPEFERLWNTLVFLHRESRKLEEINRLLNAEEQSLSNRDRSSLRQLRKNLDWNPLKLKKKEECYIGKTEYSEGRFDKEKYNQLMAELVYDEITLWNHLSNEKTRIKENVLKRVEEYNKFILEIQHVKDLIVQNNAYWTEKLSKFYAKHIGTQIPTSLLNDQNKEFWIQWLADKIAFIEKDISFLNRALEILTDIENRLHKCKP